MAKKFISCYTEGSSPNKKWMLVDDEYIDTIIYENKNSVDFRRNQGKTALTAHPTGLTSDMLNVVAKVQYNLKNGKSGWSGLKNENSNIRISDGWTPTTSTSATMSANPQVSQTVTSSKETVTSSVNSTENVGILRRFLMWLFGF